MNVIEIIKSNKGAIIKGALVGVGILTAAAVVKALGGDQETEEDTTSDDLEEELAELERLENEEA